jgi:hypothetical protein
VHLAFSNAHKPPFGPPQFDAPLPGLTVHGQPVPRRTGPSAQRARRLRRCNDFLRYLDRSYDDALFLRERAGRRLLEGDLWLTRWPGWAGPLLPAVRALGARFEQLIPTDPQLDRFLAKIAPDLVLVSPLIDYDSGQVDLVKSARAAGVPVGLAVGSWDHLTTKSQVHVKPDRTFVWNQRQKGEALAYHGLRAHEVEVVGASAFDKWFGREPSRSHDELCVRLGLPAGRPFVLYACSSKQICGPAAEASFVEQWLKALRRHPALENVGVVIRPHPQNLGAWVSAAPERFPGAVVHPRTGANPIGAEDRAEYFDTLFHCAALVGINTSAMVEAAVVGRTPLTVLADRFNQRATLHFRHLLPENGGCLVVARDLDGHVEQLARVLADPTAWAERLDGFVSGFIRPAGRERAAADRLAEAALALAQGARRTPRRPPLPAPVVRMMQRRPARS